MYIFGLVICCMELVFLKDIPTFVGLNILVIFRIGGLQYVNIVHVFVFFLSFLLVWAWLACLYCMREFSFCIRFRGKLLFCAICSIDP
jgi:hypothetical protein